MKLKKILTAVLLLTIGGSLITGCASSNTNESSESVKNTTNEQASQVNIAIQPSAAFIPLYIAKENGWIEEALSEYKVSVNWNDFESGPPMNESLAAGSSDIGVMGDVPTVSAIAAGQKTEIVSMTADGAKSYALLVPADSNVTSIAQLKGKKLATVVGSTGHNLIKKLLEQSNLDINKDIELVNISAGDASTVLSTKEVDAVAIWEPNVTRLVSNGTAKVIAKGSDCGLLGVNQIVARSEYAKNNPKVITAVIQQYEKGIKALEEKTLDDSVVKKVAEYLSIEPEQLYDVAAAYDYKVDISDADIESFQDTIKFLVTIGNLDKEYDITEHINKSYLDKK